MPSGQLLLWECFFFLSQEMVQFLTGWKSVCGKLHKGRNMTEPTRRRARGCGVGCATNGHCFLRTGTAWGLPDALALCKPLASRRMNHWPRLEKQQVKRKQMDPAFLRNCCRLRAQAAGVGVSVLSQLCLCQALARACSLDKSGCCLNLLRSRKGLILFSFQRTGAGTQLGQPSLPSTVLKWGGCPLPSLEGERVELPRALWNLRWQNSSYLDRSFTLFAGSFVREMCCFKPFKDLASA